MLGWRAIDSRSGARERRPTGSPPAVKPQVRGCRRRSGQLAGRATVPYQTENRAFLYKPAALILHGRGVMPSTIPFTPRIHADPALHIRTATEPLEISQLRAILDHEHYLKAGRPAGHVLWQGVYQQDPEEGSIVYLGRYPRRHDLEGSCRSSCAVCLWSSESVAGLTIKLVL